MLVARFEPVSKEMTYGASEPKATDQRKVPAIATDDNRPTAWLEPDPKEPLTVRAVGQSGSFPIGVPSTR